MFETEQPVISDETLPTGEKEIGETSDGYHTFNELYEHRHLLFAQLVQWKSKKHSDGTMFDGWFIAGINKEKGKQITYHIPMRLWDSFKCEELENAPEWDGHTPNDVIERLKTLELVSQARKEGAEAEKIETKKKIEELFHFYIPHGLYTEGESSWMYTQFGEAIVKEFIRDKKV